ncbi:MAG: RMD1 family protein [Candidatus Binataceae bacterium]|nr:RMD1 family protein [Candidatus Binataceae bacterium]
MAPRIHQFNAIAFEENLNLKQLVPIFPGARSTIRELRLTIPPGGGMYVYPFGAVVTHDVGTERRDAELAALRRALPKLTAKVVREDYTVAEDPEYRTGIVDGVLRVDRFTPGRAGIVALTVGQSAATEYYEQLVEDLFARTARLVEVMERRGTVPFRTRPLHRFIGEAITTRTEVLSVLHLLDKPDEAWDDPAMDLIYDDLRAEFDLRDRYTALEMKLRSIQETLELLVDVARDRRLLVLEVAVVFLILLELVFTVIPMLR